MNGKNKKKQTEKKTDKKSIKEKSKIDSTDKWYCHACDTESFEDMRQCPLCVR